MHHALLPLFLLFIAGLSAQGTATEKSDPSGFWRIDVSQSASEADNDFIFSEGFLLREDPALLDSAQALLAVRPAGFAYQLGLDSTAGYRLESVGEVSYTLISDTRDTLQVKDPYLLTETGGVRRLSFLLTERKLKSEFQGAFIFEVTGVADQGETVNLTLAMLKGEYLLRRGRTAAEKFYPPRRINDSDQLNYLHYYGRPAEVIINHHAAKRTIRGKTALGDLWGQDQYFFELDGTLQKYIRTGFNRRRNANTYVSYFGGSFGRAYEVMPEPVNTYLNDSVSYVREGDSETIRYFNRGQETAVSRNVLRNGRVVSALYVENEKYVTASDGTPPSPLEFRYDAGGNIVYSEQTQAYNKRLRVARYRYTAFDEAGNWTRRETYEGNTWYKPEAVATRTIRYYPK